MSLLKICSDLDVTLGALVSLRLSQKTMRQCISKTNPFFSHATFLFLYNQFLYIAIYFFLICFLYKSKQVLLLLLHLHSTLPVMFCFMSCTGTDSLFGLLPKPLHPTGHKQHPLWIKYITWVSSLTTVLLHISDLILLFILLSFNIHVFMVYHLLTFLSSCFKTKYRDYKNFLQPLLPFGKPPL